VKCKARTLVKNDRSERLDLHGHSFLPESIVSTR
jgi:hypothetical protein